MSRTRVDLLIANYPIHDLDPDPDPNPNIEYTPSWLNSVVCLCAVTGVRRFRGIRLHSNGGRILKIQSSHNSTVAAEILTESAFIRFFVSVCWEQSLGVCCVYTPT